MRSRSYSLRWTVLASSNRVLYWHWVQLLGFLNLLLLLLLPNCINLQYNQPLPPYPISFKKMRYIMKGGVWKNSEDQILKAAIMKYGLNQWSRISSLLQRKSAKQCKQRWYEWLDPSIKKTEWTRTEDEKLLQLARVFPSQWRTIAPFVGRTPTQCYDRYEKLLDIAQGKNPNDPNNLRKLRPDEIDPNPQTKPARPDPIDMDQDQKQMLAQVRVRLANTKGKKAKRKQRQKIIDEARRLAQLQKARELKMAGVENIITQQELKRLKQKKDIDYNKEVPFKREVPDFAYKTEQSQTPASSAFALNITLQAMEGRKREIDQEIKQKTDKRRLKKFREKDISSAIMQKRQLAKPPPVPISLPQPQLADRDLQQLKKLNITTPLNTHLMQQQQTPAMTPQNKILLSAGVNLSLNYSELNDQDVTERLKFLRSIQDRKQEQQFKPISERIKTPVNQWEKDDKGKLQRLLKGLRKAQNQIQFQIPEQQQQQQQQPILDAEQYQRQQHLAQQKLQQQRLKTRSQVLKKQLPRLPFIPTQVYYYKRTPILEMIQEEYVSLVYSDAVDYPVEGMEFPEREIRYRGRVQEGGLEEARAMVRAECEAVKPYDPEKHQELYSRLQLLPQSKTVLVLPQSQQTPHNNLKVHYQSSLPHYHSQLKKSNLNEKKCTVSLAGFENIIKEKTKEVNALFEQLTTLQVEFESLKVLREQERVAIRARVEEAQGFYKMIYESL